MEDFVKTCIYAYIDHHIESAIDKTLHEFLDKISKPSLFMNLSYMLKEIVSNANKANLKRAHFIIKKLDIEEPESYESGIMSFKENIQDLSSKIFQDVKRLRYYIKIDFIFKESSIILNVTNNNPILPVEVKRMEERIKNAEVFQSLEVLVLCVWAVKRAFWDILERQLMNMR